MLWLLQDLLSGFGLCPKAWKGVHWPRCPLTPVQGLAMPPQTTYGTPCTGALTYHSVHGKNEENIKILRSMYDLFCMEPLRTSLKSSSIFPYYFFLKSKFQFIGSLVSVSTFEWTKFLVWESTIHPEINLPNCFDRGMGGRPSMPTVFGSPLGPQSEVWIAGFETGAGIFCRGMFL